MRLTTFQIDMIQKTFRQYFGPADHLWLFGSRADDAKKGGDNDLYVQTPELDMEKLSNQRSRFVIALYKILGEQTIEIAIIELFTNRFAKLQDLMSVKLFPLIMELIQEPHPPIIFIDLLNRLEKREILPSAEQWINFRRARNSFTHDYPDDSQENANALNKSIVYAAELLDILENIKIFTARYL